MRLIRIVLFGLCAWGALAAVPTISNITVDNITHASFRMCYSVTANSFGWIQYGTSTGSYPYSSSSYGAAAPTATSICLVVTGLAPATTYYVLPTARPNSANSTDICNISGCGAVEQQVTTLPEPFTHPIEPDLPQNPYYPTPPDTTGYPIISFKKSDSLTCVLAADIGPTDTSFACVAPLGFAGKNVVKIDAEYIRISGCTGTSCNVDTTNGGGRGFVDYAPAASHTAGAIVSGAGECVAAEAVAAPPGAGWIASVQANQAVDTVYNEIGYPAVLEFPQGAACPVFPRTGAFHVGYIFTGLAVQPGKTMDDPTHGWIVFRTAGSAADFPPPMVRTGPQWSAKLAKFVSQVQATTLSGDTSTSGQIIQGTSGASIHHLWFENLEFTHRADSLVYPTGVIDPKPFALYIQLQPGSASPGMNYLVFDRLYMHSEAWPSRIDSLLEVGGNRVAVMNSHFSGSHWMPAAWPTANVTASPANQLNVPAATYKLNNSDAACGIASSATVTVTGGTSGGIRGYLKCDGLHVRYTNTATVSCTNCTLEPVTDAAPTVPFDGYNYFRATISASTEWASISTATGSVDQWSGDWKPLTLKIAIGGEGANQGPISILNNYFSSPGQTVYVDQDGTMRQDVVVRWNSFTWDPKYTRNALNPDWDGYEYHTRNPLEFKIARRWLIDGNVFQNIFSYENTGSSIQMPGAFPNAGANRPSNTNTGISHITITNNTIKNAPSGITCAGSGQPSPDVPTNYGIKIANNEFIGLNRYKWSDATAGNPTVFAGYISIFPGCTDMRVQNNTGGFASGMGPFIHNMGGGGALGEGLYERDNIWYLTQYSAFVPGFRSSTDQANATFPRVPQLTGTGTQEQQLGQYFIRTTPSGVVPNFMLDHNLIVGGQTGSTNANMVDLTQSQVTTFTTGANAWPAGNWFPNPVAGTMAAREAEAGFINPSARDYRLRYDSPYRYMSSKFGSLVGADEVAIKIAQGEVRVTSARRAAGTARISYIKYDPAQVCYYYVGTSPTPTSWTADSTATTFPTNQYSRLITAPAPPGSPYYWRMECTGATRGGSFSGTF